jgi:hypothetical protein
MIPQGKYSPRRVAMLQQYLVEELRRAQGDRSAKEKHWIDWQEAYRAQPIDDEKTFPFTGASNLVIPLIATDVDTIFARMMGMLFEPPGLWSVTAQSPEMELVAPRIDEFLRWAQHNELELQGPIGDWLVEMLKLGTAVLKQRYHREMKKVYEWRELGAETFQQQAIMLLKDSPRIDRVALHDFYVPAGFKTLQEAPWCAERINLTWAQFMNRVQAGIYEASSRISEWDAIQRGSKVQREYERIGGYTQSLGNKLELYEFWLDFDIDEDGYDEALVCTIHVDSQTYVRLDFNPFFNQEKPYSVARFMRDENSFYGIGLCEMLSPFQEEVTAMHNQRLDNATVDNSSMFAVDKNNLEISEDEPIYPGKIWFLNSPADIQTLQFGKGTGAAASVQNERVTVDYSQRRTGVTDYMHAQPEPSIGYAAAYTTQQMMLNSTRRQGEVLREVRRALSESGTRTLELYQQFNQRGKEYFAMGAQDGQLVRMVLQFPLDLIRRGLRVSVTAIDVAQSKDAQIRTHTLVLQQLLQYYMQFMQFMQIAINPQVPQPMQQSAIQMMQGASIVMRRLLDSQGIQDIDKMIPELGGALEYQQRQLAELQQLIQLGGGGGFAGAQGGQAPPGAAAGGYGAPNVPPANAGMGAPASVPAGGQNRLALPPAGGFGGNGNGAYPR